MAEVAERLEEQVRKAKRDPVHFAGQFLRIKPFLVQVKNPAVLRYMVRSTGILPCNS